MGFEREGGFLVHAGAEAQGGLGAAEAARDKFRQLLAEAEVSSPGRGGARQGGTSGGSRVVEGSMLAQDGASGLVSERRSREGRTLHCARGTLNQHTHTRARAHTHTSAVQTLIPQ